MKRTLVIGGGFMGMAIAQVLVQGHQEVFIYEMNEALRSSRAKEYPDFRFICHLNECKDIDVIIEAIPEKLELKQELFQKLEREFPQAILCTNTSSFLISHVGAKMHSMEKLIGTHFFSPANISPLVEIIPTAETDPAVVEAIFYMLEGCGKRPVRLNFELPGFIGNRLQSALAREAMSLVEKGIATAEDIDFIAKWALGIRLAITGPLEQRDINGLDTHLSITEHLYQDLENSQEPLAILQKKVQENKLGMKTKAGFYNWQPKNTDELLVKKDRALQKIIEVAKALEEE